MKHTFTFLFKDLGYFIAFWVTVMIEVAVVASGWYNGWSGWLALCAVIPACSLVGLTLAAELHRRSLREALAWQAFMQGVHNRDNNGLPEKYGDHGDMTVIKKLEVDVKAIPVPPREETFTWSKLAGKIVIGKP